MTLVDDVKYCKSYHTNFIEGEGEGAQPLMPIATCVLHPLKKLGAQWRLCFSNSAP